MMNLSYWEKDTYYSHRDVVIVGGGFAGLWCAIELKTRRPSLNIALLDKGVIPTGASTRNAGFSCFGSPTELLKDAANLGEQDMWQLVEWRYKGLLKIQQTFAAGLIDYETSGGYECLKAGSPGAAQCEEGLDRLNAGLRQITGQDNVFYFDNAQLSANGLTGFDFLISNRLEGLLHPARLLMALQQKAQGMGVQLFNGIDVVSFEQVPGGVHIETEQRIAFNASQLLVCNNAFAKELLPQLDIQPARGQVLLTSPVEELALKGSFHYDNGFYYFRNLGNRVLLGGARNKSIETENTTSFITTNYIQKELELFLQTHILPGKSYTITDRWAGIMGMSSGTDKMPVIQAVKENIFCAVRMSGMGVALAPVTAEMVAELMLS
jgi:gamma-glutamylputrescine oxidase